MPPTNPRRHGAGPSAAPTGTSKKLLLLVEDDPVALGMIAGALEGRGFEVVEATSGAAAEEALAEVRPRAALLDYQLPDGDALGLLGRLRRLEPDLPVVILTAHGSIELAVEAMLEGADHFLTKPPDFDALAAILERAIADRRSRRRRRAYDAKRDRHRPDPFVGRSAAIRRLASRAGKLAASDLPLLIVGETGSGKGVLARWLHDHSPRAEEPFVDLNCAGLKPEFLESELFGHRKGAFTGADRDKPGLLEVADQGTFFLDEIGDLDPGLQPKLLKVLEEQRFRRLGEVDERRVDVRFLAATHQNLRRQVRAGTFRDDLYFRLKTLELEIPPLRRRRDDIPLLAELLLEQVKRRAGRPDLVLAPETMAALVAYRWPGNIRELRNVLEHAVLVSEGATLERADLLFERSPGETDTQEIGLGVVAAALRDTVLGVRSPEVRPSGRERPSPADAWQSLRTHLRRQVATAADSSPLPPLGRWLADDLVLAAHEAAGGVASRGAALLGIAETTYRRRLRQAEDAAAVPRSPAWEALGRPIADLVGAVHPPGSDLLTVARDALLAELSAALPAGTAAGAALMGVSPPTFRLWRQRLTPPDRPAGSGGIRDSPGRGDSPRPPRRGP